jgi:hypothetical protein
LTPTEVRIEGRNLDQLYDTITFERISWVRELPASRDFRATTEPVVHRITILPIER